MAKHNEYSPRTTLYSPYKGDLVVASPGRFQTCTINNCLEIIFQEGRCLDHWLDFDKSRTCGEPKCGERPEENRDYCPSHYKQCDGRTCGGRVSSEGGYCKKCRQRKKRRQAPQCSFKGCSRKVRAKGLCKTHYENQKAGKTLKPIGKRVQQKHCSFPECDRPHFSKGYCKSHDQQRRRGIELKALYQSKNTYRCTIENCNKRGKASGFCTWHYQRFNKAPECPSKCKPAEEKLCAFHLEYYVSAPQHNRVVKPNCTTEGCKNAIFKDGQCTGCRKHARENRECEVRSCRRKHKAKGLCNAHYGCWQKLINNLTQNKLPRWTPGQIIVCEYFQSHRDKFKEYSSILESIKKPTPLPRKSA
jgi:hypothetical protein